MTTIMRAIRTMILSFCHLVARIFGIMPPTNTMADAPIPDPAEDIRQRLEGLDEKEGFVPPKIGTAVHAYASASNASERSQVDLSALSTEQLIWLTGLSFSDLERLAKVGPNACERAASGRKCGVVGLPVPARMDSNLRILRKDSQTDADHTYSYGPGRAFAA